MNQLDSHPRLFDQYLLGALPESEVARLDELAITDDDFAAKLSEAENDLVDKYVRDELRGEILERFKTRYLSSSGRRDKVKFAMALMETHRARGASIAPVIPTPPGWLAKLFARPAWQWSFAAAAMVVISFAGWMAIQNVRLRRQLLESQATAAELIRRQQELQVQLGSQRNTAAQTEQELAQLRASQSVATLQKSPEAALVATLFLTPQMRGAGQVPIVKIGPMTKSISAQLELEPNDYSAYRVELVDSASHQTTWTSGALKAAMKGDRQMLSVPVSAGPLRPQTYSLRLFGVTSNGTRELISDYSFKVVK